MDNLTKFLTALTTIMTLAVGYQTLTKDQQITNEQKIISAYEKLLERRE